MAGAAKRIEREKMFADRAAWDTARLTAYAFHKPGEMPDFDKFRGKGRLPDTPAAPPVRQDWRAMQAQVIQFNASVGGSFRK